MTSQDKARANHQARHNKKSKTCEFYITDFERLKKARELGYKSQADMLKTALDALKGKAI